MLDFRRSPPDMDSFYACQLFGVPSLWLSKTMCAMVSPQTLALGPLLYCDIAHFKRPWTLSDNKSAIFPDSEPYYRIAMMFARGMSVEDDDACLDAELVFLPDASRHRLADACGPPFGGFESCSGLVRYSHGFAYQQ